MTNLVRKSVKFDLICSICQFAPETLEHIFFQCHYTHLVWFAGPCSYKPHSIGLSSFLLWRKTLLVKSRIDVDGTLFLTLAHWHIWKDKNRCVFYKVILDSILVLHDINYDLQQLQLSGVFVGPSVY